MSVGLSLDALNEAADDGPERRAIMTRASDILDDNLTDLRLLLTELAPPEFHGDLDTAMHDLAEDLSTQRTSIELALADTGQLGPETSALLYRVTRELIRNATQHAVPNTIEVDLQLTDDHVILSVTDDGHGFNPANPATDGHLGLSLIHHAVVDGGGHLSLESGPEGTRVVISLPVGCSRVGPSLTLRGWAHANKG